MIYEEVFAKDFRGNKVTLGEIVGVVYYHGELSIAKIEKISNGGKRIKISFALKSGWGKHGYQKVVSKWKSESVICKLDGDICPDGLDVFKITGEMVETDK